VHGGEGLVDVGAEAIESETVPCALTLLFLTLI
jgi:hypothetical protein